MFTTNLIEMTLGMCKSTLTMCKSYDILGIAKLLNEKTIELGLTALPGLSIHPNCLFVQKLGSFGSQLGCLISPKRANRQGLDPLTDSNHSQADGGLNKWLNSLYILSTSLGKPHSSKSTLTRYKQLNTARSSFTPTASSLASSRYFEMEIYRFRVYRGWYAYVFLEDAQAARQQFLDNGHPHDAISEIEKAEDGQGFEFKMNSIEEKRAWLHPQESEANNAKST